MLLSADMQALSGYLNPSKLKLKSKGVDSVISRVMNLQEQLSGINHEIYCKSLAEAFKARWSDHQVVEKTLKVEDMEKIDKLMEIYN